MRRMEVMPSLHELQTAMTPPERALEPDDLEEARRSPRFGALAVTIAIISAAAVYLASFLWPFA